MSAVDDIARVAVSRGHLELVQPHARIYGESLVLQSLERHRTGHWLQQRPEPVNTLRASPGGAGQWGGRPRITKQSVLTILQGLLDGAAGARE